MRRSLFAAASALFLGACGYVGDPLPPALYIPLPVTDLSAMQQGDTLVARFTLPSRTTEDLPVGASPEVELRAAAWENRAWDETAWERESVQLPALAPDAGVVISRTPAGAWTGQRLVLRVRVAGKLGRFSSWSEPVALRILAPAPSIHDFRVASAPAGVRLSWAIPEHRPAGMLTEIYRKSKAAAEFARLDAVPGGFWDDHDARFGQEYVYQVRERLEQEGYNYAGPFLGPLAITPADTFAPAPPAAVDAVAGAAGVELSWDRNQEADFQEYRVYRSVGSGPFERIGEPASAPVFSDENAPFNVPLKYRVTSVDDHGNESAPSSVVEITRP